MGIDGRRSALTFPDRLDVVIGDRSAGGAAMVTIDFRPRWVRIGTLAVVPVLFGVFWWMVASGTRLEFGWLLPLVLAANYATFSQRKKIVLTDEVLARAAATAASQLGRQVKPGVWRIEGRVAGEVGGELNRLHNWWTTPDHTRLGYRDPVRERQLLAEAKPVLKAFMVPVLSTQPPIEPDARSVSHEPGQPWPILGPPESTGRWPVVPPDAPRPPAP